MKRAVALAVVFSFLAVSFMAAGVQADEHEVMDLEMDLRPYAMASWSDDFGLRFGVESYVRPDISIIGDIGYYFDDGDINAKGSVAYPLMAEEGLEVKALAGAGYWGTGGIEDFELHVGAVLDQHIQDEFGFRGDVSYATGILTGDTVIEAGAGVSFQF